MMSVLPKINEIPLENLENFKRDLEFIMEKHTGDSALIHRLPPTINPNSNRLPVPQPILAITQNNKQLPKESKDISIIFASKNQSHASFQNPGLQCVSMGIAFLFWM